MNLIEKFEREQIEALSKNKNIPDFKAGDTVNVSVKVIEGTTERIQNYEGVVMARSNKGVASSFLVRKISHGQGVERRFLIYSPIVAAIKVVKKGVVRRAKIYYLRQRKGKAARIKERIYSAGSK